MRAVLALCLIAATALPAGAENILKRPNGCERIATAQYDDCKVTNHFKCAGSAPVVYREETIDGDGVLGVETFDKHRGTVGISDSTGDFVSLKSRTEHPRAALMSGRRSEVVHGKGTVAGVKVDMTGRLDSVYEGATTKMAGETFHRMPYKAVGKFKPSPDFKATVTSAGSMLFHEQRDLWVTEVSTTKFEDQAEERFRIKQLSLPGQSGFGATQPKFGCSHLSMLGGISEVPA